MKPEQLEIERLRREVAKLKAERDILKKSRSLFCQGRDMKFAFVAKHRSIWPVAWLCEARRVSRSGFHAWFNRSPSEHARHDEVLLERIKQSFQSSDRTYGTRRVWHDVLEEGLFCGPLCFLSAGVLAAASVLKAAPIGPVLLSSTIEVFPPSHCLFCDRADCRVNTVASLLLYGRFICCPHRREVVEQRLAPLPKRAAITMWEWQHASGSWSLLG